MPSTTSTVPLASAPAGSLPTSTTDSFSPQLVGESRGDVHVDADDLAAAHAGQRRVLGVDAHAQGALLADDRGRHLGGLQLRLVGARIQCIRPGRHEADREQRPA